MNAALSSLLGLLSSLWLVQAALCGSGVAQTMRDVYPDPVQATTEVFLAKRHGVHTVPALIFCYKAGRGVFRHVGHYSQREMATKLKETGVE